MARTASKSLLLVLMLFVVGCQNPKNVRVTQENKDKLLEQVKDMKGLTVEEAGLLYGAVLKAAMAESLGGKQNELVGKTVGEIILQQRLLQEKERQEKQEQDRLAAEAKAKADAVAAQLRNTIQLTVFDKSFRDSDPMNGEYNDYIIIKCAYQNKSEKNVRAFVGKVRFTDLFGKEIFESGLTVSDPIAAGAQATWTGTIDYNQFSAEHKRLRNADMADMNVVWMPENILFEDGSRLGAPE